MNDVIFSLKIHPIAHRMINKNIGINIHTLEVVVFDEIVSELFTNDWDFSDNEIDGSITLFIILFVLGVLKFIYPLLLFNVEIEELYTSSTVFLIVSFIINISYIIYFIITMSYKYCCIYPF